MRWTLTLVATAAALALIAASCALNFAFWSAQGKGTEGLILGAVSIAVDLMKAVLPVLIGFAIASRRWTYVAVASPLFLVFFVAGLISAVGFVAGNRGESIGGKEARNAQLELAAADLKGLDEQLSKLTGYPPIAALEAEIQKLEQNHRFASSSRCVDATATASRSFCEQYFQAKANLGRAIEANRLTSKRDGLIGEVNRLRAAGAGTEADPQAGIFARWIPGLAVGTVRDALALFFAVLVEFGAAFGLFLAGHHGGITVPRVRGYPVNREVRPIVLEVNHAEIAQESRAQSHAVAVRPMRFVPDPRWVDGRSQLSG